jgi:hypothetical protein
MSLDLSFIVVFGTYVGVKFMVTFSLLVEFSGFEVRLYVFQ